MIRSQNQLETLIQEWGFLPFFRNGVEGFSIEENTPEELWFSPERPGPWEWKGGIIANWQSSYGKFFAGKTGYISMTWLPDFINWRRHRFPLSAKTPEARHIYGVLCQNESLLSHELKKASGYSLSRKKSTATKEPVATGTQQTLEKNGTACDALIAELEMATYVCIADFEYKVSRAGQPYGWGVARYCTPEAMYGEAIAHCRRSPQQSYQRIIDHLAKLFPASSPKALAKLI